MNKAFCLAALAGLILCACARLPAIRPWPACAQPPAAALLAEIFPSGDWQLTHAIEAHLPAGRGGTLMGVVVLAPSARRIDCALVTVEGLSLFEARQKGDRLQITRQLPPFDRKGMAKGLMADVALIFLRPEGEISAEGDLPDGRRVIRFRLAQGGVLDVIRAPDKSWELRVYDRVHRLRRTVLGQDGVVVDPATGFSMPRHLTLQYHGLPPYSLILTLIDAQPL